FLLRHDTCQGIFNATAPHPVSNAEFSQALGKALHRPACLPMPALLLRLAMGEMSELLTEGQFVIPKRALEAGFRFKYPQLQAALTQVVAQ
ncbi:MAG: DUF1731 domain-containing protein, partial [Shewanella sp.]